MPPNPPRKTDNSGIPDPARGRDGLIHDLQDELIAYTPERLIALAENEFAWCEAEMRRASRELGLGDDWKAALEKTKTMHPLPGGNPTFINVLIHQAIDYVRANDLVTVPEIDAESRRMITMTPERPLVNPLQLRGLRHARRRSRDLRMLRTRDRRFRFSLEWALTPCSRWRRMRTFRRFASRSASSRLSFLYRPKDQWTRWSSTIRRAW